VHERRRFPSSPSPPGPPRAEPPLLVAATDESAFAVGAAARSTVRPSARVRSRTPCPSNFRHQPAALHPGSSPMPMPPYAETRRGSRRLEEVRPSGPKGLHTQPVWVSVYASWAGKTNGMVYRPDLPECFQLSLRSSSPLSVCRPT
jgi:hypothetical protein